MNISKIYAVEISGVCNLSHVCEWCPMHQKPQNRKRGLMNDETIKASLRWVDTLGKVDALALHVFGEPLLHPKFDEYALAFSKLTPITMSTNGVLLDDRWADRLAAIPWAWISVSPWDKKAQERASHLLLERNIKVGHPPGITHDFAAQAAGPKDLKADPYCPFLFERKSVIWWDGRLASCCITDRDEDSLGSVFQDFYTPKVRPYSICENCHHGRSK